ncbi:MAG: thioesterase domain-containing protein, partial [Chloroflexota bacterium]
MELGEIQNVLLEHPAVKQALVISDRTADSLRLAAYVELQGDTPPNQAVLKKFLSERLPEYMVPSAWVILDRLPLNASGKIDRLALPLPYSSQADNTLPFEPPHDELELKLVKLWEHLLEYSPISINENFFEIGGHSLLVVRLVTQLEKELGKPLSLALIFHAPTIAAMAAALRKDGWKPTWSSLVPIRTAGSLPPLFCVHADGGAFFYVRFANYLPQEQPFYGLQARGLDGLEPPFDTVEEMARHYITEIRSVQPAGPYLISGFSMGGVVIYEMAKQLKDMGEKSLIIFLDASSPAYPEFITTRSVTKIRRLFDLNMQDRLSRLLHRLNQRRRWLSDEILSRYYLL